MVITVIAVLTAMTGAAVGGRNPEFRPSGAAVADIPAHYLTLYQETAAKYDLDWAWLAAIGKVETDHGRLTAGCATSSAGARGPMQFMPGTWALYGRGDICDPAAAIDAAARYLVASGAPRYWHGAVLAYNHAEWYYRKVAKQAQAYRGAAEAMLTGPTDIIGEADRMQALKKPYVWGGGHAFFTPDGPWDCSGAMSWLMHKLGLLEAQVPLDSTGFLFEGSAGRGHEFTIWTNPGHVFLIMESGSHKGEAWGTTNNPLNPDVDPDGGPAWHHHTTVGFTPRHYAGH